MALCDKNWVFANGDALPACQREATHLVEFAVKGQSVQVRSCEPCTVLFTLRPTLKAVVTPLKAEEVAP